MADELLMGTALDALAYLVRVGGRPFSYMFAGLVVGLLFEHLDAHPNNAPAAFGLTALIASSVSLIVLPPLLWVNAWAHKAPQDDYRYCPVAVVAGVALSVVYLVWWSALR